MHPPQRFFNFDFGDDPKNLCHSKSVPAVKQDFTPDSMSTDLHTGGYRTVSMTNVLSKFRAMGVPLNDLIRRSTANPAREIQRPQLGTPSVGTETGVSRIKELQWEFSYIRCV